MTAVSTSSPTGDACIDALLGNLKWATSTLTYSFPSTASPYGKSYGSGEAEKGFAAFNAAQQSTVRAALKLYADVCNVTFQETAETTSLHADLRFASSDAPSTAWAYFPTTYDSGGDVWVNNSSRSYANPKKGNYAYLTIVHEIGHALGLKHAHEGNAMPAGRDSLEYTVMTYRSYVGASATTGYQNETWGYAQTPMIYDVAALQHLYGANYATNGGDTQYAWSPNTGEMFVNGSGQGAPGGDRILQTVWDGGGTDTYDFSRYKTDLTINLQPGTWTKTEAAQLAKLNRDGSKVAAGNIANALLHNGDPRSLIENATGGSGNDTIKGNVAGNTLKGGAGNDKLYGLSSNDVLVGGSGKDLLNGGIGVDCASYGSAKSGVTADLLSPKSNRGEASGDTYSSIENLSGSSYADTLRGNNIANSITGGAGRDTLYGRGGNDALDGGSGNDKLYGQGGQDTLTSGSGSDVFVYKAASDSRGSTIDTIMDFAHGADRIDLRGIDANSRMSGNQAFDFIDTAAFSSKAGQLRFADGMLSGDVNGDGIADFQVKILGVATLAKDDFHL